MKMPRRYKIAWSVPWPHVDPQHWFRKNDSFQDALCYLAEIFDVYVVAQHKVRSDRVVHKGVNYWFCPDPRALLAALVELQPDLINYWGYGLSINRQIDELLPEVPKTVYPVGEQLIYDDMPYVNRFFVSTEADRERVMADRCVVLYPRNQVVVCPFTAPSAALVKNYDPAGERYDVVYLSAWREIKRQHLLIEALPEISFSRVGFVGPRDEPPYFERWLPSLRQQYDGGYVELVDAVPPQAVPGYFREAKVAVQLSRSEGGSRVLIEALASGVPLVVCSDCRVNCDQIVHGETGLIVEPTPTAIAAALNALLLDPDLRQRIGTQAVQRSRHQRQTASMARIFEREFSKLLAEWRA